MSNARSVFLARLTAYRAAVLPDQAPWIVEGAPSEHARNARARLFRNGLAVVGFAILEDFLRERTGEVLGWLSKRSLPFSSLPDDLQTSATSGAVRALSFHYDVRRRSGDDVAGLLRQTGMAFASTGLSQTIFAPLALGWERLNLSVDEVGDILRAFEVADGWRNVELLAGRAGFGSLTLRTSFVNALVARNTAAHRAAADVRSADLEFFAGNALGIGFGFDAVLSRGAKLVAGGKSGRVSSGMFEQAIGLRFLDADAAGWVERREASRGVLKRESRLRDLKKHAIPIARRRSEVLVVRDRSQRPLRWIVTDVP